MRNDNTISHETRLYQIEEATKGKKVQVEQRINGSMKINYQGEYLKYKEIIERPARKRKAVQKAQKNTLTVLSADNPWRETNNLMFERQKLRKLLRKAAA